MKTERIFKSSPEKLLVLALVLLVFGMSNVFGQLSSRNGETYTTEVTVKFRQKAFDVMDAQGFASLSAIRDELQSCKNFFSQYGEVQFKKVFPNALWGDTTKFNIHGEILHVPDLSQFYRVLFPRSVRMWEIVYALRKLTDIEFADPPTIVDLGTTPNDLNGQGTQWNLAKINATSAWDISTGSSSIVVAVIDNGVDASHADLSAKVTGGETGYAGGSENHGTRVAGVVGAATNNGLGIASLGWNVMVMPFNYSNSSGAAADITSAVDAGANILNCSWFTVAVDPMDNTKYINYDDSSVRQSIESAISQGRIVVAAGGNPLPAILFPDSVTRDPSESPPYPIYPASYSGVIAVSATNSSDQFPSGYNYGSFVAVSAPSIAILTTGAGGTYPSPDGTSFGSPLVAGLAGLILSKNPNLSASQVASTITLSTDKVSGMSGQDYTQQYGYGRINASKALHNLYVPGVYSTIASALSVATSGQTIIVAPGTLSISNNVTIPSGVTLQVSPGATLTFTGYYKLRVEGTLVANGAQGNPITFQGGGYSGSWFGIEFYNATAGGQQLAWCIIKDASYGLNFINTSFGSAYLTIRDNTYGVNCTNYSDPTFNSTVFQTDSWGVNGDATSAPSLTAFTGYNSFRTNDYYDIYSTYSGTIYARGNWWGACPPYPSVTANVDYSSELCVDPNFDRTQPFTNSPVIQLSKASRSSFASTKMESGISGKDPGMNQVEAAYRLYLDGKYDQALQAFERNVSKYPEYFAGERSLVFVERTLEKLGRSDEILASLNNTATTYGDKLVGKTAAARRVYQYIKRGQYQDAIAQASEIVQQVADTTLLKFALYDLGSSYWYGIGDTRNGAQYYGQLIARFPSDPLSRSAEVTLGLSTAKSTKQAGLAATSSLSAEYDLQNYPNPFNPSTTISYQLTAKGSVSLRIYNMLGQEVAALVDGERLPGYHQEMWDASRNPSGVYVYQLIATDEKGQKQVARKRMLLLK